MKYVMYISNRMWLIILIYIITVLLAAFLFSVFENKNYFESIWWACVTSLTIGYGDYAPATVEGRITGIVFGHLWIFGIIPMIIANIVSRAIENNDNFTHEEQLWQKNMLEKIANKLDIYIDKYPKRDH